MKRLFAVALIGVFLAPIATAPTSAQAASPAAADTTSPTQKLMSKLQWRSIGPFIGGRVVAIVGVPSEPSLFYMGGVQGGVWRSSNYGTSWENLTDGKSGFGMNAYSIGALAVAPSNPKIIYAGTGESDLRGDFSTGDGIYKTTDAGKTWAYAGLRDTHTTTALAIDPRDPNVVYASSMGHVFAPNAERGVFKTTDGGKTWTKVLFVDENTGANDVVMDVRNPNVLYATMWQASRKPWNFTSGGPGSGLYKTSDGGAHWSKISDNPGFARGLLGKMGVSVSVTDPRSVYAIVQAQSGGIFHSTDGGATWKRVNAEMKLRQRAFYYTAIYADPTNAKVAYAPQVDGVFKTTDSGKTWKAITRPGDHHIIWINPRNPKILLEGDDGGAMVSVDGGKTWSSKQNQPTDQFYKVAIDKQFPFHVYGASQDHGAFEGPSASQEGLGIGAWHNVALGESTWIAPDPNNPYVTYGSGYQSSMARFDRQTGEQKNVSPWPKYMSGVASSESKFRFGWTHPIFFSPSRPHELLVAGNVVFSSSDYGERWQQLSPDLTRNDPNTEGPTGGPINYDQTGVETFPDISSLAVSPLTPDLMWAGSADGLVHVTTDHGAHWKLVTPPALPQWAQISSIEPSHVSAGTAYLSSSRYQWDDFHPYIYKTTDYGATWSAMTSGLPDDQYVFAVRQDPRDARVMFAGTRSTAYVSLNGGGSWEPLTLNLPYVQVRDIGINARQGSVVAATHGRSFWILDNLSVIEQTADGMSGSPLLFAPETAWLTHEYTSGTARAGTGQGPTYGTSVFFDLPSDYNGTTPATLAFLDATGRTVRSFTLHLHNKKEKKPSPQRLANRDEAQIMADDLRDLTAVDPGMNLFVWDMRYGPATEARGVQAFGTDDFSDTVDGPTIVPGKYSVVLTYGGEKMQQPFRLMLDPRLHPASGELAARLALSRQIIGTLDAFNRAVNAAEAARASLPAARRAQVDAALAEMVQFNTHSSEGDLAHESKMRDHLAFLLGSLDLAYQAPTPAEYAIYNELRAQAAAQITRLREAMH
ncbi:MAG TPA: YCF48-related protein [Candidatus Rubrimentiphilum sp.]|nr:YCF48-related protein [Candidatus Rubrimentiphilum sp.]